MNSREFITDWQARCDALYAELYPALKDKRVRIEDDDQFVLKKHRGKTGTIRTVYEQDEVVYLVIDIPEINDSALVESEYVTFLDD